MEYYIAKTIEAGFDEAVEKVTEALKEQGFGVLTDIDIKATLKKKIDVDFRPYRILGACNPPLAHKALEADPHIGIMLPCNVIVQQTEDGTVEVAAMDPVAAMSAVDNAAVTEVAEAVRDKLQAVIDAL